MSKPRALQVIPGIMNNLMIHTDYDTNPNIVYPVLFYTPNMRDTNNHYHVKLSLTQAKKMNKWLSNFIESKKKGK